MRRGIGPLGAALACALAGCAVGPDFARPAPPTVERYTVAPLAPQAAASGVVVQALLPGRDIPADWWRLFRSPALDAMLRQALAANPDLQAAEAASRAAGETVRAQRAAFFPTVSAQYEGTRQGIARPLASPLDSGADRYTLHTAQLAVGYVPDVFGANRRQLESAQAQAEVQREQLEAARLTLAANLVEAVVQRASTLAQVEAVQALAELSARQLALAERQQRIGTLGAGDVALQAAALAQARALLPPLEKQAAQQADLLAGLLGRLPAEAALPEVRLEALTLPEALPLSLPSALVAQRPDVRAAEAQWRAANAQIGVAIANRLPNVALVASGGSTAVSFAALFGAGTGFWSLGASVAQPLFDGGALLHRQRGAEALRDQAAAQYRSTVIVAFQNVADTLQAIDADARALARAVEAEQAAARSLAIARRQQAAGTAGVLAVLGAEQAWRQATLGRIQAEAARLVDSAALFQSLGGGWWNRAG